MWTALRLIALTLLVGVGVSVLAYHSKSGTKAAGSVERVALTAVFVEQTSRNDGKLPRVDRQLIAVRSDGAEARVVARRDPASGALYPLRIIFDPQGSRRLTIHQPTGSLTTYTLPAKAAISQLAFVPGCSSVPSTGHRSLILGHNALKIEDQSNKDVITKELWVAPDLGCFPLRTEMTTRGKDGSTITTVREAVTLIVGDPSASLFDVPEGLVERSPAEVAGEYIRRNPGHQLMSHEAAEVGGRGYRRPTHPRQ